jgi:redox-sensitive bicupin YhaK (pirin superfamily)
LLDEGQLEINGKEVNKNQLHFIPAGAGKITIKSKSDFRALLIGGTPFEEEIIMWWNFIGRTHDEIAAMRNDWQAQTNRFNSFEDRIGGYIPAPALPSLTLKARGSKR